MGVFLEEKKTQLIAKSLRYLFPFVILEKLFYYSILFYWFLLLILLNNFRSLFKICINIDIDMVLLIDKTKGLGFNSFRVISLCNS